MAVMVLLGPALVVGVAAGYLLGGRLHRLADATLRGGWWLAAAVALQTAAWAAERVGRPLGDGAQVGVLLASLAALLVATLANRRLVGMAVAATGIGANLLVVALNGAMPVSLGALRRIRPTLVDLPAGAHRAMPDGAWGFGARWAFGARWGFGARLGFLGDVVALPALGVVVSVGDILLALGVALSVAELMRGRAAAAARERPRDRPGAP
jgi:hypothetical protein